MQERLKRFNNLMKCHYNYAFNKAILAMILAIVFLNLLYNITIVFNLKDNEQSYDLYKYYFETTFPLIIFLGNVLIMTVFSYSFLKKQDQYCMLLMTSNITKSSIFLSKYFTVVIFTFLFCIMEIGGFYVPIFVSDKLTYVNKDILWSFLDLFFEMLFYGNITLILVLLFDNFYCVLLPLTIFLLSYNYTISQGESLNMLQIIITFNYKTWRLSQNYGIVIAINLMNVFISHKIYLKNEC